jgi:hypothetical protein
MTLLSINTHAIEYILYCCLIRVSKRCLAIQIDIEQSCCHIYNGDLNNSVDFFAAKN